MGKLDGKVAVITGAAVGLGAGIAEAFVKHGAKICMINRSERVEETAERLRKQYNAQIITAIADVSNREQVEAAVKKTVDTFGAVHIACCNAGVCQLAPFEQMTDENGRENVPSAREMYGYFGIGKLEIVACHVVKAHDAVLSVHANRGDKRRLRAYGVQLSEQFPRFVKGYTVGLVRRIGEITSLGIVRKCKVSDGQHLTHTVDGCGCNTVI